MKMQDAVKTLDEVIPPPDNNMVDLAHLNIAIAWKEIRELFISGKKHKVELLALLESYRLLVDSKKENNPDHAIRVCQAIIAGAFGYESRTDWTRAIQAAGLIDYRHDVDWYEQYKTLTESIKGVQL